MFNKKLHIQLFTLGLLFSLCISGQEIHQIQFDISMVPFSRYGSYLSFSTMGTDQNGLSKLNLFQQTGRQSEIPVFSIETSRNGKIIPVKYTGTPIELIGKIENGAITCYFENEDIIHILGTGTDVVLTGSFNTLNAVKMSGQYDSWKLLDELVVLTARAGTGKAELTNKKGEFVFKPGSDGKLDIVVELYKSDWLPKKYTDTYDRSIKLLKNELNTWSRQTPEVSTDFKDARNLASYINWASVVKAEGNLQRYGMLMSKNWMINIWSWDNCFNAMSLSYGNPKLSWDQLMIMFDLQDETGAMPDCINSHHVVWSYKKPPIHGWTLSRLMEQYTLSPKQMAEIYTKLSAWTNYWFIYRDEDGNGLPEYYHGNDSGWDNGTAFDSGFPAEGPDLSAFLVIQMDVLADLAKKLDKQSDAVSWKRRADETLQKMIARFWNGDKFVTKKASTEEYTKESQSLMSYLPLLLGKRLPDNIRIKMISDLKKPGYLITNYGIATESPGSKLYVPDGYWRGPVWAPTTMIIVEGLKKCGEKELADKIAQNFCETCKIHGFAENFNALTGEPLRDPAYTWTTSVFLVLAHELYSKK